MPLDAAQLGAQLAEVVRAQLVAELGPIRERLATLEARPVADTAGQLKDIGDIRERLARLEERKPEKGEPGRDGLGLDDIDVQVLEDDRTIELAFRNDETEKVFTLKWPTVIDRGVYKAEQEYAHGDAVTFGGSMWIATKDTSAKPGDGEDWRLAVKKGRDGKDAR